MKSRVIVGAAIALATLLVFAAGFVWSPKIVAAFAATLGVFSYLEICSWQDADSAKTKLDQTSIAQLLWALLFSLFAFMLFMGGSTAFFALSLRDLNATAGVVAVAYATDTSAMGIGKLCKKVPLIGLREPPLLKWAPTKTVAGFIGGYLGGLFAALFLASIGFLPGPPTAPTATVFFIPVVAILADLLGSAFKRCSGVKDSGQVLAQNRTLGRLWRAMLPHGGFLDRFGTVFLLSAFIYIIERR